MRKSAIEQFIAFVRIQAEKVWNIRGKLKTLSRIKPSHTVFYSGATNREEIILLEHKILKNKI